jgi:hypothetical protein
MGTANRLLFFMILSCHDSVASSSVGRVCGIPLTIILLTSLWAFPFSIAALVAAGRAVFSEVNSFLVAVCRAVTLR